MISEIPGPVDLHSAAEAAYELLLHGDFRNGVTDSTGSIDEGDVRSGEIIDRLRGALDGLPFQARVYRWMIACFGAEIAADKIERNHRFLEEALELVQAGGCSRSEAHQLVDYVFDRPVGDLPQEMGGVMVTLAAFGLAHRLKMNACGETELARVWTKVEQIRAKQAAKPQHSPLPEHPNAPAPR